MKMKEIVREIPEDKLKEAWQRLIDLLLRSSKANRIPVEMSKAILSHWLRDSLRSREGVQKLLEAAVHAEPDKTASLLSEKLMLPGLGERLTKVERG